MLLNRKRINFWAKFVAVAIVASFVGAAVVQWGSSMLFEDPSAAETAGQATADNIASLEAAFKADPGTENVALALADAYQNKGEIDKAVATLTKALAKNPKSINMNIQLGGIYLSQEDAKGALTNFMLAIKEDPASFRANLGLAFAYELMDKKDLAVQTLNSLLKTDLAAADKKVAQSELARISGSTGSYSQQ